MKVKSENEAAQSCPTLSDPMDCSLPGSSIHGIFQARVLLKAFLPRCKHLLISWLQSPSTKMQTSSDFMAAVTIHSDFGDQEEEICHYFHLVPLYLP